MIVLKFFRNFWPSKKTREEEINHRIDSVFTELTSEVDFEFTELEIVQILNEVRRKLGENLRLKRSESLSKSVEFNQKAKELENVIDYIQ